MRSERERKDKIDEYFGLLSGTMNPFEWVQIKGSFLFFLIVLRF